MTLQGRSHCGNISYVLQWPAAAPITARACGCTFCRKHGGCWTSHPDAQLAAEVADGTLLSKYRFGTGTAEFFVCARCGVAPFVASTIDGRTYAVVNVNAFDNVDPASLERTPAHFEGEATDARLERRTRHWISDVSIRMYDRPAAPAIAPTSGTEDAS
jgi:hypothetical protein